MLIDEDVRLRSLVRAMQEVIIPAMPQHAPLALEQAHLVSHHLSLMLAQCNFIYRLQLSELAHFYHMLSELRGCLPETCAQGPDAASTEATAEALLHEAEPIASLRVPDSGHLVALTNRVREAVDQNLQQALAAGGAAASHASRIVLDYAARQILRERVAVKTAGFDQDAAALPALDDVT